MGREDIRRRNAEEAETALGEAWAAAFKTDTQWLGTIKRMGELLTVRPLTLNWADLEAQEWRYSLFLHYVIKPPELPSYCDGCGTYFFICHPPYFQKGGLITARHNEIRDGVANLAVKAFTPAHMRKDPTIFTGHVVQRGGRPRAMSRSTG